MLYIDSLRSTFDDLKGTLHRIASRTVKFADFSGRLKSPDSLRAKMSITHETNFKTISDIIGIRITCQNNVAVRSIVEEILQHKDFKGFQRTCYGFFCSQKRYDVSGYRRIHLTLKSKNIEIQVGTPYTDMWTDWFQVFVHKGPLGIKDNLAVVDYSKKLADYFWMLDELRTDGTPKCPMTLTNREHFEKQMKAATATSYDDEGYAIYPEEMKVRLDGFPDGCFWWDDAPEKDTWNAAETAFGSRRRLRPVH